MSFGKGAFSHRHKRQVFVRRFRLPKKMDPKKGRNIIIVEKGEGFELHEHNFELDGQWQQVTCPKKSGIRARCAICRKGYRPYWVAAFTIIDRDKWKDRQGKWHKDEKKVLMVKDQSMGRLEAILAREKSKDLQGQEIYTCRTGGQQSPAIGDIFDPVKKWSEKALRREFADQLEEDENFLESYDYNEVFASLSDEELEDIAESLPRPEKSDFGDRKKGSSFKNARGDDDDDKDKDEGEGRRVFRGKKGRDDDEPDDEAEEDEDEEEKKPSKKPSKASDDEDEEDEEDADEEESEDEEEEKEEKPKKPSKKPSKASDDDEEAEEESEEEEAEDADEEEADEEEEEEKEEEKKPSKKPSKKAKAAEEDEEAEDADADEEEADEEEEEADEEEKAPKKKGVKGKIKF